MASDLSLSLQNSFPPKGKNDLPLGVSFPQGQWVKHLNVRFRGIPPTLLQFVIEI